MFRFLIHLHTYYSLLNHSQQLMSSIKTFESYYTVRIIGEEIKIPKSQIKTIYDLKKVVENISGIEVGNQKLIKDHNKIAQSDSTNIQALNVIDTDKLCVLTIKPLPGITKKKKKKQQEISLQLKIAKPQPIVVKVAPEKSEIKKTDIQLTREILAKKGCKQAKKYATISKGNTELALELWKNKSTISELAFLTSEQIDRIIISLIQNGCFREYQKQIITKGDFWRFMLNKIAQNTSGLTQIFQQYPQKMMVVRNHLLEPEPPLTQKEQSKLIKDRLNRLAAQQELVQQLAKKFPEDNMREKIIEAVSISQNQIDKAIQIIIKGSRPYYILMEQTFNKYQDEQFFLLQYLAKEERVKRIKLAIDSKYLDAYTLAMKYRSTKIFHMLVKNRKFVQKIIAKYRPSPNFANQVHL